MILSSPLRKQLNIGLFSSFVSGTTLSSLLLARDLLNITPPETSPPDPVPFDPPDDGYQYVFDHLDNQVYDHNDQAVQVPIT
jgi:hypothetical protein